MKNVIFWCLVACGTWIAPVQNFSMDLEPGVETAFQKYQEALAEEKVEKRTELLNEALSIYLSHVHSDPSGTLLANIGDVYYSFGQYGYAIGYYRRALCLIPEDKTITHNLRVAVKTAQVEHEQIEQPFFQAIGFQCLAPNERFGIALGLLLVTFVMFSLNTWMPSFGFKIPWRLGLVCCFLYIGPLLVTAALQDEMAVVLKAAPLRSMPSAAGNVLGISVEPGQMLYVEGCEDLSQTVRVRTSSGVRGILLKEDIMFVGP